jgi:transposase-like protein
VITGIERRRRWSVDEKLAIIAESYAAPISISDVARRHGLNRNQLFLWRRQFRDGELCGGGGGEAGFVPVVGDTWDAPAVSPDILPEMATGAVASACGLIEVVIGAITVRVPLVADEASLRRVLGVVRSLT